MRISGLRAFLLTHEVHGGTWTAVVTLQRMSQAVSELLTSESEDNAEWFKCMYCRNHSCEAQVLFVAKLYISIFLV